MANMIDGVTLDVSKYRRRGDVLNATASSLNWSCNFIKYTYLIHHRRMESSSGVYV